MKKEFKKKAIEDYLDNIQEYNEKLKKDKYTQEISKTNDVQTKLEYGLKAIESKLRSEDDGR